MSDVASLFKKHFMHYASYVILERAIPHLTDGLKPVQRRLLWTLFQMDDGKMHKVANIAGRTMALHPHGDAPIVEALVVLANKGYLISTQGNFGNPLTGDPHAAARYIEARLSPLAKETLFNTDLIEFQDSYDGRNKEPLVLSAKIPLLLLHGVEGIAVGMTTKIFPHNFQEILEAQIALLKNKPVLLFPDFPSGGIMDASEYEDGKGSITIRAKVESSHEKIILIKEICPSTTTESLIKSIENAAKKGQIKIDSIQDFSTDQVNIEIKLPKGVYAKDLIPKLYQYTECQVTLHPKTMAIFNNQPIEPTISEILEIHNNTLQSYLKRELEIAKKELLLKQKLKLLEYYFIKHELYHVVKEDLKTFSTTFSDDDIFKSVLKAFKPFIKKIPYEITKEDSIHLQSISIKKILKFEASHYETRLEEIEKELAVIIKNLSQIKKVTETYLKQLLKKYSYLNKRKTILENFLIKQK